jgi:hypothetical protein
VRQPGVSVPQPPRNSNGVTLYEATNRPAAASQRAVSQPGASVPRPPVNSNSLTLREATYHQPTRNVSATASAPSQREISEMRPAVQNVIRALYGMPPEAREREIDSGRYSTLSPQELEFVRYAAGLR